MSRLQETFDKLQGIKKEQRELKSAYREALTQNPEHKEVTEKIKQKRDRKKQLEEMVRADFSREFNRLDSIKTQIEAEQELLSDLALNKLTKGELVKVTDMYENEYEPVFNVRFRKLK